jgi:hypothetical protein
MKGAEKRNEGKSIFIPSHSHRTAKQNIKTKKNGKDFMGASLGFLFRSTRFASVPVPLNQFASHISSHIRKQNTHTIRHAYAYVSSHLIIYLSHCYIRTHISFLSFFLSFSISIYLLHIRDLALLFDFCCFYFQILLHRVGGQVGGGLLFGLGWHFVFCFFLASEQVRSNRWMMNERYDEFTFFYFLYF